MDIHPFALVRPQSRLLDKVVRHFLTSPREQLLFQRADVLYTYALHDYVAHAQALELLIHKLSHVSRALRDVLDPERALLPLSSAPRLLQALQRLPLSVDTLRLQAEGAVVGCLQQSLPRDGLAATEVSVLWRVAVQCARWESVRALLEHFPLRQALAHQPPEEFIDVISAVCTGGGPAIPRERLLRDVLREDEAWRLCAGVLQEGAAAAPLRNQAAVLRVILAARRGRWPEEEGEREISPEQGSVVAPMQAPTLHVWSQQMHALHHPCIPPTLREVHFHMPMVQGLWQLYTTMSCEGVMGFFTRGLPLLVEGHPDFPWRWTLRRYHDEALLSHKEVWAQTTPMSERGSQGAASLHNPPSVDSLVNIIVSSALLRTNDDGEGAYLPGVLRQLGDALKKRLCGPSPTSPPGGGSGNLLRRPLEGPGDAIVRRVPLVIAVYVVVALEKILNAGGSAGPSREVFEAAGELLELLREHVLRPNVLDEHGNARAVASLLLHCPNMTRWLDLEQTCVRLLTANYRDGGFTREQLERVLEAGEPGGQGCVADRYGIDAALRKDLLEVLEQLPVRRDYG